MHQGDCALRRTHTHRQTDTTSAVIRTTTRDAARSTPPTHSLYSRQWTVRTLELDIQRQALKRGRAPDHAVVKETVAVETPSCRTRWFQLAHALRLWSTDRMWPVATYRCESWTLRKRRRLWDERTEKDSAGFMDIIRQVGPGTRGHGCKLYKKSRRWRVRSIFSASEL